MSLPVTINNCTVHIPPSHPEPNKTSVFLAGSIEMGKAIDWQEALISSISDLPVSIFNPRRFDFDSTLKQDISEPTFNEQVSWELDQLNRADIIALYFQSDCLAPISLLELGLFAKSGRIVVCCPQGFWRRGNVQIVCERYGVPLVETIGELEGQIRAKVYKRMSERVWWNSNYPCMLINWLGQALFDVVCGKWLNGYLGEVRLENE